MVDQKVVGILQDLLELVTDLNANKLDTEPCGGHSYVANQRIEITRKRIAELIDLPTQKDEVVEAPDGFSR